MKTAKVQFLSCKNRVTGQKKVEKSFLNVLKTELLNLSPLWSFPWGSTTPWSQLCRQLFASLLCLVLMSSFNVYHTFWFVVICYDIFNHKVFQDTHLLNSAGFIWQTFAGNTIHVSLQIVSRSSGFLHGHRLLIYFFLACLALGLQLQLIYLFSKIFWLGDLSFVSQNSVKCGSQFPRAQGGIFKLLVLCSH